MRLGAPRSLLGQLIVLQIAIAMFAAVMLSFGVSAILHGTAKRYQHALLRRQGTSFAQSLGPGGLARPQHAPILLADGMAIALLDRNRAIADRLGPSRPAMTAAAPLDRRPRFFARGSMTGLSLPAAGGWIIISQDAAAPEVVTDDIVAAFLRKAALLLLPIAVLMPLVGALLTRRLTRRMQAASAIAGQIGPRTLDVRIPTGMLPIEVEPLATATNDALDRLAEGFRTQAAFAADIAHELRTPLAAIRLRADAVPQAEMRAALLVAVDRAARVVGQLLALADLEQRIEDVGGPVDLHALAEAVVADRAPAIVAGGRSIALEGTAGGPPVFGYAAPLALAIENLVDNAARHTPAGTAIVVQAGPGARLAVIDDGPGVPATQLARLKDRFWRADGSRAEGAGIGLSIVERIAKAHRGTFVVAAGPDGRGLECRILLGEGLLPSA